MPAALVVVVGTGLNELFVWLSPGFALSATDGHLVSLPVPGSPGYLKEHALMKPGAPMESIYRFDFGEQ